ncbi:MAG: hypothetical protein ACTSRZ_11225 [Promethearchaeota archaeon]
MPSEIQKKVGSKMPWLFKIVRVRIPKVNFPTLEDKNLDIPTPSRNILLVILYVFLFWLLMGGVYLAIPDTNGRYQIALGADSKGNPVWLYPSINDAFIIESFVAGIIIFIGAFGFLVLYQSTKHLYNVSYAQRLIVIGLVMATFSFATLQYIVIARKARGG